jgi:hypothetical protein
LSIVLQKKKKKKRKKERKKETAGVAKEVTLYARKRHLSKGQLKGPKLTSLFFSSLRLP